MTGEEKILAMLEKMDERQTRAEAMLEKMDERQTRTEEILEKHSAMLEKMDARQTHTEEMLEKHSAMLEKHSAMLEHMQADMTDLKSRQERLEMRQDKLEILIENDIKPTQQLILETVTAIAKRAQQADAIPEIRETVDLHTEAIRVLNQRVSVLEEG